LIWPVREEVRPTLYGGSSAISDLGHQLLRSQPERLERIEHGWPEERERLDWGE
jgi:hypothetical protein